MDFTMKKVNASNKKVKLNDESIEQHKKKYEEIEKCIFDNNGCCKALACYSSQECYSRDKDGNPAYD